MTSDPRPDSIWKFNNDYELGSDHFDTITEVVDGRVYYTCSNDKSDPQQVFSSPLVWFADECHEVVPPPQRATHWRVKVTAPRSQGIWPAAPTGVASWTTNTEAQAQYWASVMSSMGFDTKVTALKITETELT